MTKKLRDDCFLHDEDRLAHADAVALLKERMSPVVATEILTLDSAAGRILAEDIAAPQDIPAHTNAAVDGYAFAYGDYVPGRGATFAVSGRAAAGGEPLPEPARGTAVRIFTGAAMPQGLDTVVMQEDTEITEEDDTSFVTVPGGLKQGANCRKAGEDVKKGSVVLRSGQRLRPQDLAAASASGRATLSCFERLRVAVFSTGDEVVRPGEALGPGEVYDANAPMLRGLIEAAGAECIDLGVLPDNATAVQASLQAASDVYDVVITSGGASRGEEDHVVEAVDILGKLHMWQIAVKPGRPMSFGQIGDSIFLGLPGNPVAVFVCFLLYVRPVLLRLGGSAWVEPTRYPLRAAFTVEKKKTGRREYWRGILGRGDDGMAVAEKFPRDGSGLISGLCAADGLIEVPEDVKGVAPGDTVAFIPFSEFGIRR